MMAPTRSASTDRSHRVENGRRSADVVGVVVAGCGAADLKHARGNVAQFGVRQSHLAGGVRAHPRCVAGCGTPKGSAGQAGKGANVKLHLQSDT